MKPETAQNMTFSLKHKNNKIKEKFYETLRQNQGTQHRNVRNSKSFNMNNPENINTKNLLFAFNKDNKYKAVKKVKKYSNLKRIPSGIYFNLTHS